MTTYCYEGSCGGYPIEFEPEPEEQPIKCELCERDATDRVDLDPILNPGRYMVDLCRGCADFERNRIEVLIRNNQV